MVGVRKMEMDVYRKTYRHGAKRNERQRDLDSQRY